MWILPPVSTEYFYLHGDHESPRKQQPQPLCSPYKVRGKKILTDTSPKFNSPRGCNPDILQIFLLYYPPEKSPSMYCSFFCGPSAVNPSASKYLPTFCRGKPRLCGISRTKATYRKDLISLCGWSGRVTNFWVQTTLLALPSPRQEDTLLLNTGLL